MKIKKGDQVKVITGKSKGTVAKVLKVHPKTEQIVVEGVNLVKKHQKPTQLNPDGGILEMEAPIHVSNVMIYDAKAKKAGRVGHDVVKGEKVRVNRRTGAVVK